MAGRSAGAGHRVVAWNKEGLTGAEFAVVDLAADGLRAEGCAVGFEPMPYRLEYTLLAGPRFVTSSVVVEVSGDGWGRRLELARAGDGTWSAKAEQHGTVGLAEAGGDVAMVAGAADVDLALSPLSNTMPVLRAGLLDGGGGPADFLMAWISVPDLSLHPSPQRYTHLRTGPSGEQVVRFEAIGDGDDFTADVVFDADGLVIDYPGIAARYRGGQGVSGG